MATKTHIFAPTLTSIAVNPAFEVDEDMITVSFMPMLNDENEIIPGVVAIMDITMFHEGWLFGAVSKLYFMSDDDSLDRDDIDSLVNEIVDERGDEAFSLLWDTAVSGWKATSGLMREFSVDIPLAPKLNANIEVGSISVEDVRTALREGLPDLQM